MYNDNPKEFIKNLNYACRLIIDLKKNDDELSVAKNHYIQIQNDLNDIEKNFNLNSNKLYSENTKKNEKIKENAERHIKDMYNKIQKVFLAIIFIVLSIISAVNIFLYGYDKIQKSYFPIKYGLVSFFQTIEIILLILGKIILLILLLAVSIFICYLIALLISTLITSLAFLIYKHSSIFKRYDQKLREKIDLNNHNTNQKIFINKNRKENIINNRRCELTAISDEINNIDSKINDLKTKLNNSILPQEYSQYWNEVDINEKGYNLVNFSHLTQIYELDYLLFAFKQFLGKDLKFKKLISKSSVLTNNEFNSYKQLLNIIQGNNHDYNVFGSIRLIDLFYPIDDENDKKLKEVKEFIINKQIDFALISNSKNKVILLIELDDYSHLDFDRIQRDLYINILLCNKGYKLLRTDNHNNLSDKIIKALDTNSPNIIYDYSQKFEKEYKERLHYYVMNPPKK